MREIKFRYIYKNKILDILTLKEISERNYHWADDVVVEQYTGLKDKNGIEIYEGDIVELDDIWECKTGVIEFYYGLFGVRKNDTYKTFVDMHYFYDLSGCEIEIIGNIHETPELLK